MKHLSKIITNTRKKNVAEKTVVLVDINVLMDVIQRREPYFESSARLLDLIFDDCINGWVAAHSLTTLFYLIKKYRSSTEARQVISSLLQHFNVAPVDENVIKGALELDYKDFEDAVQMMCAVQCKADYLITRNVKDYQPLFLTVIQPVDFIAAM
jgi:predicted nucleic acid-binding protein